MKALATLGCGLLLVGSQSLRAEDKPQSIMFEANKDYSEITTLPADSSGGTKDRCAELAAQVEALKGKPQRRYAASQLYEAECKR